MTADLATRIEREPTSRELDAEVMRLTATQQAALLWLWPDSERRWNGDRHGLRDPGVSSLMSLCRKGFATKSGSEGWAIHYRLTNAGRKVREALRAMEMERGT